jgi:hypothetical protein
LKLKFCAKPPETAFCVLLQIFRDFEINIERGVIHFKGNDLQKHLLPKLFLLTSASLNLHTITQEELPTMEDY